MNDPDDQFSTSVIVRTIQIIIGALTAGPLIFLMIVLFVIKPQPKPAAPTPLVSTLAVIMAATIVPLSFLIPALLLRNARRRIADGTWAAPNLNAPALPKGPEGDAVKLTISYQTALIAGAAMADSCAFLSAIACMLEGQPWMPLLAGVCILAIAARFPTRGRFDQWLAEQQERIAEERITP